MVADNAADMRRALQRVAVEYPTSDWSDDALVRLVQMDYATRSFDAAARNLERLRQDFPAHAAVRAGRVLGGSDVFRSQGPRARLRVAGRRNGPGRRQPRAAEPARLPVSALRREDRERQRRPARQRARPDSGARPDSAAAESRRFQPRRRLHPHPDGHNAPDSSAPASAQGATSRYRVQVAAVATPGAADDAADTAEKLGYPAVIVRERGFYKVRAGTFATRDEAQAAVKRIKSRMGGNPFVVASNP